MLETLRDLFSETLGQPMPPFHADTAFAVLPGWDSVAHLALLLAVERRLGVAFTSAEMVSMRTVGDMLSAVEAHRA